MLVEPWLARRRHRQALIQARLQPSTNEDDR
jgi:hypothetical protein